MRLSGQWGYEGVGFGGVFFFFNFSFILYGVI